MRTADGVKDLIMWEKYNFVIRTMLCKYLKKGLCRILLIWFTKSFSPQNVLFLPIFLKRCLYDDSSLTEVA